MSLFGVRFFYFVICHILTGDNSRPSPCLSWSCSSFTSVSNLRLSWCSLGIMWDEPTSVSYLWFTLGPQFDILIVSQSLICPIIVVSYDRRWPIETPLNAVSQVPLLLFNTRTSPCHSVGVASVIIFCSIFCSLRILWVSCFLRCLELFTNLAC